MLKGFGGRAEVSAMFDAKDPSPEAIGALEQLLDPGEKLLVAERVRRVTTPAEWIGMACRAPLFLLITDQSLRLVKRGFRSSVEEQQARLPISWVRSLQAEEPGKKLHLYFSDGSSRSLKLSNERVIPYLNSLRPWVESTFKAAVAPRAVPTNPARDLAVAEAW